MASQLQEQRKQLECPICFEQFEKLLSERAPLVLPCGHTMCVSDVKQQIKCRRTEARGAGWSREPAFACPDVPQSHPRANRL
jgi:hypothetical protein